MWQELVAQKDKWVGGRLIDYGDSMDRRMFASELPAETKIVDMKLTNEYFEVNGEKFSCGGARSILGITAHSQFEVPEGGLAFSGYGGHEWHIVKPTGKATPREG